MTPNEINRKFHSAPITFETMEKKLNYAIQALKNKEAVYGYHGDLLSVKFARKTRKKHCERFHLFKKYESHIKTVLNFSN
jgi:hypothetical protein